MCCCAFICKQICKSKTNYKKHSNGMYQRKELYCSICECAYLPEELLSRYCPCCGCSLRHRPNNPLSVKKLIKKRY